MMMIEALFEQEKERRLAEKPNGMEDSEDHEEQDLFEHIYLTARRISRPTR
jgi:hypothetical protein